MLDMVRESAGHNGTVSTVGVGTGIDFGLPPDTGHREVSVIKVANIDSVGFSE